MLALPAIMGGVFAVRKERWGLAMVGGIMGTIAVILTLLGLVIPFWGLIALILFFGGIVGTILVGVSRREFVISGEGGRLSRTERVDGVKQKVISYHRCAY